MILDPGLGLFHPLLLQAAVLLTSLLLSRQQSRFLEDAYVPGDRGAETLNGLASSAIVASPVDRRARMLRWMGWARARTLAQWCSPLSRSPSPGRAIAVGGVARDAIARAASGCSLNPTGRSAMPDMT
jgi:hypothetical protein